MAVPKVTQRKVNKGIEQPIYVRYSYPEPNGKPKDYFAPTGYSIDPAKLKGGRIVDDLAAPEINEDIQRVVSAIEWAIRTASAGGRKPYAKSVKAEHLKILRAAPKAVRIVAQLTEDNKNEIQKLEDEVTALLAQVEDKRVQIIELKKKVGEYQPELLSGLIDEYITHRNNVKPKNSTKRAKKSFASSTQTQFEQLKVNMQKFNPILSIREIDKDKMQEIEEFLVNERYYNSTTFIFITKLLTVLNYYQPLYGLSKSYKEYSFELPMRDESVIYLTTEELRAFRSLDTYHKHGRYQRAAERVKDLALLMTETALRYSDSAITQSDIQGGYIVKAQQKTGHKVYIPFTDRLRSICEKYEYKLKGGKADTFNLTLRRLLGSLPVASLHKDVTVINYIGSEPVEDTRKKYLHCGAHTLRRTMINQCLIRNLRYDQITKITGHKDFDAFQTYVDRDTKAAEMDSVFNFLDEPAPVPVMRVA